MVQICNQMGILPENIYEKRIRNDACNQEEKITTKGETKWDKHTQYHDVPGLSPFLLMMGLPSARVQSGS